MAKAKLNAQLEHRIAMGVIVDTYTEEKRALSWYYYLGRTTLKFPFEANVRNAMAFSPAFGEANVTCVAPLAQIVPLNGDKPTRAAVADWHYWHYGTIKAIHSEINKAVLPTSLRFQPLMGCADRHGEPLSAAHRGTHGFIY